MGKITSLEEAAQRVESGMTLGLGGMTNYRRPVGFVTELIRQGHADDLTLLGLTLGFESDLLVAAGLVSRTRTCYFGLEYLPAPAFTKNAGSLDIVEESEASIAYGLRAALAGVGSMPGQGWFGTDFPSKRRDIRTSRDPYTGKPLVHFPALRPDVAVIHVEKADEFGNAIVSGNRAIDRELAMLAQYTVITAEEIVSAGEIADAYITGEMVDAVVPLEMGAFPTSCYPLYTFDVPFLSVYLEHVFLGNEEIFLDDYVREGFGELLNLADAQILRSLDPRKLQNLPASSYKKASTADIMVKAMADMIRDGETVAQGIATPLVSAAYQLAKASGRDISFANAVGNCLTRESVPLSIQGYEFALLDKAVARMSFTEAACETLPLLAPREFLRPAQVDRQGNTNNLVTKNAKSGEEMRWPGAGGIPDVTLFNPHLSLYLPRQREYNLVEDLEIRSGLGHDSAARERYSLPKAGPEKLITDLAVYSFESGELKVESVHPGVRERDLKRRTGFDLDIPEHVPETSLPSEEEMRLLYEVVDPLGVRELELLGTMDRLKRTLKIVERERKLMG